MKKAIDAIRAKFGNTVFVVHHSDKLKDSPRGPDSVWGADMRFGLDEPPKDAA